MASYRRFYNIGDTVYNSFATHNPGIVVGVVDGKYTIRWLDGKETGGRVAMHLASFDDLIQDHLKKVETHSRKRDTLIQREVK